MRMRAAGGIVWTNESVKAFAGDADPIAVMEEHARALTLQALDAGWVGPPFDPIKLAEIRRIPVQPSADIQDARTLPVGRKGLRIEYNPTRPRARVRFSIAHEIAHTFFPDCAENVRLRHKDVHGDDWQIEMLCNVGAAELIMPIGTLAEELSEDLRIDDILKLRTKYDVSTEAILIRIAKLADFPCAAFCASRRDDHPVEASNYEVDYVIPSRSWSLPLSSGAIMSSDSVVAQCVAIGFTARGVQRWSQEGTPVHVECVGLPGYPGSRVPRVAGIVRSSKRYAKAEPINYVVGDALSPRGKGRRIVAQIVNDGTPNWGGGGFAAAVRRKRPNVQAAFRDWASSNKPLFRLGEAVEIDAEDEVSVFCMIAQKGYGPSEAPRIRYTALEKCLDRLATRAVDGGASVHTPRIGIGHAGGVWSLIEELIVAKLASKGVSVTVYDLPHRGVSRFAQPVTQDARRLGF